MEDNNELIEQFWAANSGKHHRQADLSFYESSWDLLMPVVEKINTLGTINIDSDSVFVHSENELLTHIYNTQAGGKIGAVYAAVVFFIKWYNKNKS